MSQIPSTHTPRFGGTVYFKVQSEDQRQQAEDVIWDKALGGDIGFSANDKSRLLKDDAYYSTLKFRSPGDVLYVSAENDDALATLGREISSALGTPVIHQSGAVNGEKIIPRASDLKKNWTTQGNEVQLSGSKLSALG